MYCIVPTEQSLFGYDVEETGRIFEFRIEQEGRYSSMLQLELVGRVCIGLWYFGSGVAIKWSVGNASTEHYYRH